MFSKVRKYIVKTNLSNLVSMPKSFSMLGFFLGVTPDFSTASGNISGAAVASTTCKCGSYRQLCMKKFAMWDLWVVMLVLGIVICHNYCSVGTKNVLVFFVASCKSFNHFLVMDALTVHHHRTDNVQDVFRNRSFVRNLQTKSVMSNTSN